MPTQDNKCAYCGKGSKQNKLEVYLKGGKKAWFCEQQQCKAMMQFKEMGYYE